MVASTSGLKRMIKPPIPHDEEARLSALTATGVLNTGPEERFDRYTRLAQRMFDVPIAVISLVERDCQRFKSAQGVSVGQTARDISFCGHTILDDNLFIVEDAAADARFADNPMVTGEPHIRFYAGCPLNSSDGYRLGALCIIDRQPRTLNAGEVQALRDLAVMVSADMSSLRLATVDELTSLSNRRGFNMIAEQSLQMCRRSNRCASLLMLDLDGFEKINEKLGPACGDKVLVEFAQMLKSSFRDSDVLGRLGDDTFCVLLTDTDFENAWVTVERFRTTLTTRNALPGRKYQILFSASVVQYDTVRHDSPMRLLADADVLMYERKRGTPLPRGQTAV